MENNSYYSKNKNKMIEYQKKRYHDNFEILQNYNANYYQKNKSKILQNQKINKLLKIVLQLNQKVDNVTNLIDGLHKNNHSQNDVDDTTSNICNSLFEPTYENNDIIIDAINNKSDQKKNVSRISKTKTIETKTIETISISFD